MNFHTSVLQSGTNKSNFTGDGFKRLADLSGTITEADLMCVSGDNLSFYGCKK